MSIKFWGGVSPRQVEVSYQQLKFNVLSDFWMMFMTFMTVYDFLWTFFVNDFDKEHSGSIADDLERSKLEA